MNAVLRLALIIGIFAGVAAGSFAEDKAGVTTAAGSKFGPLPGLPACFTVSVQRGDPTKGPAVVLIRMKRGCTVPWHWHTFGEALMIVSGTGKVEMKDAVAAAVAPGDYVYLPGKHPHQFSCSSACTLFDVTEGAFDIHYVNKDGEEIPPDQALGAVKPTARTAPKH